MKRTIALLLIVMMLFSFGASAFAEANTETWDKMGFTLTYPEEFNNTKGIFLPSPSPVVKDGIYTMIFNYYAFSKAESDVYNEKTKNGGLTAEDTARILDAMGTLLIVIGIDGGRGAAEIADVMSLGDGVEGLTPVGGTGDITYYAVTAPEMYEEFVKKIPSEYAEEYLSLQAAMVDVMKNATYFTPRSTSSDLLGTVLQFETTDLDGNAVKSEELFAAHEFTMINIWATWCGPCKAEMPELGELDRRLRADGRDAVIIGICQDADKKPDSCREILAERNVEYLNLLPFDGMLEKLYLTSFPTTIIVNRDGVIVLPPIVGLPNDLSQYEQLIDALLAKAAPATAKSATSSGAVANDKGVFRVIVLDTNGDPVTGAMLQFCDDTACRMGETDENGAASFPGAAEGHPYTVHLLEVPDEYEMTEEEYTSLDTFCDVYIVLQKQN